MTKTLLLFVITLNLCNCVNAQIWSGATPGSIYYNSGNVGIGTTAPNHLLDIFSADNIRSQIKISNARGGNLGMLCYDQDNIQISFDAIADNSAWRAKNETVGWLIKYQAKLSLAGSGNNIIDGMPGQNNYLNVDLTSGNVGIGTNDPTQKLEVAGNIKTTGLIIPINASAGKVLTSDAAGNATWQVASNNNNWSLSGINMVNSNAGVVIIGTTPVTLPADENLKLAVNGNVYAKKLKVTSSGWADYVFAPAYKLRPLKEVEQFIKQNRHLPEIPSAEDVKRDGIDVGDNQALLLKKIEELTLYIIEQGKKLEAVNSKLQMQQKELDVLKAR